MSDVAAAERTIAPYLTSSGGPLVLVPDTPVLTLARMQTAVDALRSAEGRATATLRTATQHLGKDASNGWTRFADGPWVWPAALASAGVLAGLAVFSFLAPNPADYHWVYRGALYKFSNASGLTLNAHNVLAVGGAMVAGAGAAFAAVFGARGWSKAEKAKLALGTLEGHHLAELAQLHKAAAERPLERAAIGRVARDALPTLPEREIYVSDVAEEILKTAAADANLGDENAREEAARHGKLVTAVHVLENGKAEATGDVHDVIAAFSALTEIERAAIAGDLRERLFDGKVPRRKMPFPLGQQLYKSLSA